MPQTPAPRPLALACARIRCPSSAAAHHVERRVTSDLAFLPPDAAPAICQAEVVRINTAAPPQPFLAAAPLLSARRLPERP
ncbi:hypothetical protein CDD81_1305 [Ophiocordyceps australis]|uniref:Uncharacterized protein n=1 Tax=Ophiocordyceps australis TaxID=1399860 RepID=A0A2C5XZA7_9HYPO|nr:hypothetical protein CDD81_1305 [Ophiocordyceps australis]